MSPLGYEKELGSLNQSVLEILDFAYQNSAKDLVSFQTAIESIMPIRIYHEIIKNNDYFEERLSKTVMFDSLRERILNLKAEQRELSKALAMDKFSYEYANLIIAMSAERLSLSNRKTKGLVAGQKNAGILP